MAQEWPSPPSRAEPPPGVGALEEEGGAPPPVLHHVPLLPHFGEGLPRACNLLDRLCTLLLHSTPSSFPGSPAFQPPPPPMSAASTDLSNGCTFLAEKLCQEGRTSPAPRALGSGCPGVAAAAGVQGCSQRWPCTPGGTIPVPSSSPWLPGLQRPSPLQTDTRHQSCVLLGVHGLMVEAIPGRPSAEGVGV